MIRVTEKLNGLNAYIVYTQHDEIMVEARDDIVDRVREIVKESMEAAFKHIVPEVPFGVEPRVTDAWG